MAILNVLSLFVYLCTRLVEKTKGREHASWLAPIPTRQW